VGLFVELKVWSSFREGQLSDYREAAKIKMRALEPRIVTVTPFLDRPRDSDCHVTWSEVFDDLERTARRDEAIVFSQFAAFLKSRGMSKPVKIDKIDAAAVDQLRLAAAKLEQFNRLFELFRFNERLNAIFRREAEKPKIHFDQAGRAWFGIYTYGLPWYYAGISIMPKGAAAMWAYVAVRGDRLEAAKNLPDSLKEAFTQGAAYATPEDRWANVGRLSSDKNTHFAFSQPIDSTFDGEPQKMLHWFETTILAANAFVGSLP
jgi:hypothetical protein